MGISLMPGLLLFLHRCFCAAVSRAFLTKKASVLISLCCLRAIRVISHNEWAKRGVMPTEGGVKELPVLLRWFYWYDCLPTPRCWGVRSFSDLRYSPHRLFVAHSPEQLRARLLDVSWLLFFVCAHFDSLLLI